MERGERERWNKLTDNAKALARQMAKFANVGRVHLNDLRMNVDMSALNSREILLIWKELESRAYGHIRDDDGPDPIFVFNVPTFQTLAQSHRLTNQAPHKPV